MQNAPLKLWETSRRLAALPFRVCAVVALILAAAAAFVGAGVPWYLASVIAPKRAPKTKQPDAATLLNLGAAIQDVFGGARFAKMAGGRVAAIVNPPKPAPATPGKDDIADDAGRADDAVMGVPSSCR